MEYLPETDDYGVLDVLTGDYIDWTLAMGDVDCDGVAEVISAGRTYLTVFDYNKTSSHFNSTVVNSTVGAGHIACGDVDGDGMRLKYTGDSWTNTAPPGIIATMAAPPLYEGIQQNHVSSYTAFGTETSTGIGVSSELGTSASSTFSFEYTVDLDFIELFRFSYSRTMGKEFARTSTVTKTLIKTTSFATGSTDDAIIYHSTDYTSYKYQIIYHPFNPTIVGHNMTIDIPDAPSIIPWTIDNFNSYYGLTVGAETFQHNPGEPWTYLSKNESTSIAPVQWSSGEQIVGQGSGFTTVTIEVETIVGSEMETTISSDYGIGASICGAGYDRYSGIFETHAYQIFTGESTIYEGCVGYIQDNTTWAEYSYLYNMPVYYIENPNGQNYQVINYYVEGATPLTTGDKVSEYLRNNWPWIVGTGVGVVAIAGGSTVTAIMLKRKKMGAT